MSRLLSLLTLFLAGSSLVAGGKAGPRVLLIGHNPDHPHGSHMYMHTCGMLAKCLELNKVDAVVSNRWPKDPAMLKGVKAIVLYTSPAAEVLLEGPHRAEVDKLMASGVGLVTIHWASTVYQKNLDRLGPTWKRYLGGTWISNVGLSGGKSTLKQLLPKHPISHGWTAYEIDDEYYLNPVLDKAKPYLQVTERKGKDVIVGWVHERDGGGRSFATTLGHPYANFQREPFRRMIVNGILWAAQVDVPADGARVDISKEDLALPPKK